MRSPSTLQTIAIAPAADLRVDERVADVDRNLVPKLRQTERVADQEDIWHEGGAYR